SFGNSANHSHFIDENGSLWGTGYNSHGQIGNGGTDTLLSPVKIVDGNLSRVSVIQVSSGYRHTVFLKSDGTVWAMGLNDSGQLGDGTFDQRISPVQVSGLAKVAHVTAGHGFSLFVTQTGELWGTGSNSYGQLGDNLETTRNQPKKIAVEGKVLRASAGVFHSVFLKADGTVWTMGRNNAGQLADGTSLDRATPAQISGISDAVDIGTAGLSTYVIRQDGTLWAAGRNNSGELGIGSTNGQTTLTQVTGGTNVSQVSGGYSHMVFLKTDGTVLASGQNDKGQLGDGSNTNRNAPVQSIGLSGITQVNAGEFHSIALGGDRKVYGYGWNGIGQFGNGLSADSNTPIQAGQKIIRINDSAPSHPYGKKMTAPDGAASDQFGVSVSQSGNISAVGAWNADPDGLTDAGVAYLYQLEANGSATYLTKVTAPDAAADDQFGYSVSQSGNILAVGAYKADPGGLSDAGAAYLYQLEANGSATYLTKVTAPDGATGDNFGYSVSQSGNILAVGAWNADHPGGLSNAGAAYLYQLEANGSTSYLTKVKAPDTSSGDGFGGSVSQSGNILAVGAWGSDSSGLSDAGAAYLYQLEANGSATYLTKVIAPDRAANDEFGIVSQSGNILAVGAWGSDSSGLSDAGAAYLYQLEANGSATYLTKVTAPDAADGDEFGWSVSQSGNILAVGGTGADPGGLSGAGAIYTFDLSDYIPNQAPKDLNFTAPLTIAENQPVGTVVGEFNATDPEVQASINSMRAQVERITIGGNIADGDEFFLTLTEQNGLLETESVSPISITALASDEAAPDPQSSIRDRLVSEINNAAGTYLTASA
ncbi:MAG: hypothetical protein VW622_10190, partial [Opitutae bacterium]